MTLKLLLLKKLLLKKRFHIPGNAPSRLKPLLHVHISSWPKRPTAVRTEATPQPTQGTATGYDPNTLICAECAFNSANANFIASSSTCPARSMKNPYSHFA